jgi:hypothetical protein
VTCVQAAVGSENGTASLYLSRENAVDHRVAPCEDVRETVQVPLLCMDDYLDSVESVDFVKIDVQGGELPVLEGMSRLLERSPNVELLIEYWPFGLARAGVEPAALLDRLTSHGFCLRVCALDMECNSPDALQAAKATSIESEKFLNLYATRTPRERDSKRT